MKTIFDKSTRDELVNRINTLNKDSKRQWGRMNVCQMLKHCILADEMYLGRKEYKRVFIGRLLGRIALKSILKDEGAMKRNSPTLADFKVEETDGDISSEKKKWVALLSEYANY